MEAGNGQPPEANVTAPHVEEYEPHFDRLGMHRRVLGHITNEDHVGRGPRNTAVRLNQELAEDTFSEFNADDDSQEYLDDLEAQGLIKQTDGVYEVTEAGHTELTN